MSAAEQDRLSAFLEVTLAEIAMHRGIPQPGFGETNQEGYSAEARFDVSPETRMFTEADIIYEDGKRWIQGPDGLLPLDPLFGCMKGSPLLPDDLDPTMLIEFEWSGKLYHE